MTALLTALLTGMLALTAPTLTTAGESLLIAQAKTEQIDINSAKAEELMKLKGIGEARAKAIIKGRPYARRDDLVRKKIVPQSVYDEIKDQIIARQ